MSQDDANDFERTLALGKQLAQDLDRDDLLGRWMAHHLGDLIMRAETTNSTQNEVVRCEVADLIIRLWEHRSSAPLCSRPTAKLQPIMDALQRLGETDPFSFYRSFPFSTRPTDDEIAGNALLRVALELENTVRDAVRHIIVAAAEQAATTDAPWLDSTSHLKQEDQLKVLKLIRNERLRRRLNSETLDSDDRGPKLDPAAVLRATESRLILLIGTVRRQIAATESAEE
jgi:hypothetical protein